jgi:hypothetical protein
MKILVMVMVLLAGCAAQSPESIRHQEEVEYAARERYDAYFEYRNDCEAQGGYDVIERYGKSTRREEILGLPGRGDSVMCISRL